MLLIITDDSRQRYSVVWQFVVIVWRCGCSDGTGGLLTQPVTQCPVIVWYWWRRHYCWAILTVTMMYNCEQALLTDPSVTLWHCHPSIAVVDLVLPRPLVVTHCYCVYWAVCNGSMLLTLLLLMVMPWWPCYCYWWRGWRIYWWPYLPLLPWYYCVCVVLLFIYCYYYFVLWPLRIASESHN